MDQLFLNLLTNPELANYTSQISQIQLAFTSQQKHLSTLLNTLETKQDLLETAQKQSNILINQAKNREIRIFQLQKSLENAISQEESLSLKRKIVEFYEANKEYQSKLNNVYVNQEEIQQLIEENERMKQIIQKQSNNVDLSVQVNKYQQINGQMQLDINRLTSENQQLRSENQQLHAKLSVKPQPQPQPSLQESVDFDDFDEGKESPIQKLKPTEQLMKPKITDYLTKPIPEETSLIEVSQLNNQSNQLQPTIEEFTETYKTAQIITRYDKNQPLANFVKYYEQNQLDLLSEQSTNVRQIIDQITSNLDQLYSNLSSEFQQLQQKLTLTDSDEFLNILSLIQLKFNENLTNSNKLTTILQIKFLINKINSLSTFPQTKLFNPLYTTSNFEQNLSIFITENAQKAPFSTNASYKENFQTLSALNDLFQQNKLSNHQIPTIEQEYAPLLTTALTQSLLPIVEKISLTPSLLAEITLFVTEFLPHVSKLPQNSSQADEFALLSQAILGDFFTQTTLKTYEKLQNFSLDAPAKLLQLYKKPPLAKPKIAFPKLLEIDFSEQNPRKLYSDIYAQVYSADRQIQLFEKLVKSEVEISAYSAFIDVWYQFGLKLTENGEIESESEVLAQIESLKKYEKLLVEQHEILYESVKKDPENIKFAAKFISNYQELVVPRKEVKKLASLKPLELKKKVSALKPLQSKPVTPKNEILEPFSHIVESDRQNDFVPKDLPKKRKVKRRRSLEEDLGGLIESSKQLEPIDMRENTPETFRMPEVQVHTGDSEGEGVKGEKGENQLVKVQSEAEIVKTEEEMIIKDEKVEVVNENKSVEPVAVQENVQEEREQPQEEQVQILTVNAPEENPVVIAEDIQPQLLELKQEIQNSEPEANFNQVETLQSPTLEPNDLLIQTVEHTVASQEGQKSPVQEIVNQLPQSQYESVKTPKTVVQLDKSMSPEVFEVNENFEDNNISTAKIEENTGFGFDQNVEPEKKPEQEVVQENEFLIGGGDLDFGDIDF